MNSVICYIKWDAKKRLKQLKRPAALYLAVDILLLLLPLPACQYMRQHLSFLVSLLNLFLALAALGPWIFPARTMVTEYRQGYELLERMSGVSFYARTAARLFLNLPLTALLLAQGRLGERLMSKFATSSLSWYHLELSSPMPYILLDCALFIPICFYFLFLRFSRRWGMLLPIIASFFLLPALLFSMDARPSAVLFKAVLCAVLLWKARKWEERFSF